MLLPLPYSISWQAGPMRRAIASACAPRMPISVRVG